MVGACWWEDMLKCRTYWWRSEIVLWGTLQSGAERVRALKRRCLILGDVTLWTLDEGYVTWWTLEEGYLP